MTSAEPIIIVSGLPRSGTSLMMQMLQAGGVPILCDGARPPDASNPRGYFEYEKVKSLAADHSWLNEARGKALKVIAQLVPFLPPGLPYQFVFLDRDIGEILRSQRSMIAARGGSAAVDETTLARVFADQLAAAKSLAERMRPATSLSVAHHELMFRTEGAVDRLITFLNRPGLDRAAMIAAVDRSLYRARVAGTATE